MRNTRMFALGAMGHNYPRVGGAGGGVGVGVNRAVHRPLTVGG
jgi:hypothetical protein